MSFLVSDSDINKMKQAFTDASATIIKELAVTLVPAIGNEAKKAMGDINVKMSMEPIQLNLTVNVVIGDGK